MGISVGDSLDYYLMNNDFAKILANGSFTTALPPPLVDAARQWHMASLFVYVPDPLNENKLYPTELFLLICVTDFSNHLELTFSVLPQRFQNILSRKPKD